MSRTISSEIGLQQSPTISNHFLAIKSIPSYRSTLHRNTFWRNSNVTSSEAVLAIGRTKKTSMEHVNSLQETNEEKKQDKGVPIFFKVTPMQLVAGFQNCSLRQSWHTHVHKGIVEETTSIDSSLCETKIEELNHMICISDWQTLQSSATKMPR